MMGKYDIGAVLSEDCKLTYVDLVVELIKEYPINDCDEGQKDEYPTPDQILLYRSKLKNSNESGLIDKLKRCLDYDVEKIARKSSQEQFAMFKLLKLLFSIEKDGEPKYKHGKNTRTTIIDVIAKPRMSNIITYLSDDSEYGDIFNSLLVKIHDEVDDAEERQNTLDGIDDFWQSVLEKHYDYVSSNMALRYPEWAMAELKRINSVLKEKILDKLGGISPASLSKPEGIMKSFYTLLLLHEKLCYDYDRITINYNTILENCPSKEYVEMFIKYEDVNVDLETVRLIQKSFEGECDNDMVLEIRKLLSYLDDIPKEDYTHYKYAFKMLPLVASWLKKQKHGFDFTNGYPASVLATIIQEIVCIKKNPSRYAIRNDFVGYTRNKITLFSALKNAEYSDSILIYAWIARLENRYNLNLGASDLIKEKRQAEIYIFEIKKILYEYRNMEDIKCANKLIAKFVATATISRKYAYQIEQQFTDILRYYLAQKGIQLNAVTTRTLNILDLFRCFVYCEDKDAELQECARQLANSIISIKEYAQPPHWNQINEEIVIHYNKKETRAFFVICAFSRREKHLLYLQCAGIEPYDFTEKCIKLGLNRFVITEKEELL